MTREEMEAMKAEAGILRKALSAIYQWSRDEASRTVAGEALREEAEKSNRRLAALKERNDAQG